MAAETIKNPVKPVNKEMVTELIHCALVGDGGVGKSFLARARACGTKYVLKDIFQLHISTVWTYDHYRTTPEVKKRSLSQVDGVNCTLKLFDTFGNKEIKRDNVYSLADVIVICFSIGNPNSLQNVTKFWIKEITEKCPGVPILLCGCKVDLRYIYKDPKFIELQKSSFFHRVRQENIIYPDAGKEVAKQIGAYYYETSSLVSYGIDDLFNNAIRAVLVAKRRGPFSFAFRSFKNVSVPHLQVPHAPPKPNIPKIIYTLKDNSKWLEDGRKNWLTSGEFNDVKLIVGNDCFETHRVFLAAASPLFEKVFLNEELNSEKNIKLSPCVCKKNKFYFASSDDSLGKVCEAEEKNEHNDGSKVNKNYGRFVVTTINSTIVNEMFTRNKLFDFQDYDSNLAMESNCSSYGSSTCDPIQTAKTMKSILSENSSDSGGEYDFNSLDSTPFDQSRKSLIHMENPSQSENELKMIPSHHHINANDYYSTINEDSGKKLPHKSKNKTTSIKTFNNFSPKRLSAYSLRRKLEKNSCNFCKKFKNSTSLSSSTLSSSLSLSISPILGINRFISGDSIIDIDYNSTKTSNDVFEVELDDKLINSTALRSLLNILYSGQEESCENSELELVLDTAELLKFTDIISSLSPKINRLSSSLETVKISAENDKAANTQIKKIRHLFLENDSLADVCFGLDDGQVFAHRSLLSMRCDVFTAMFTSNFYERQNKWVDFRSASQAAFKTVQEYLYTGSIPTTSDDWFGALELANRLCLDELSLPLQQSLKKSLEIRIKENQDVISSVFKSLKLSRLIEAEPLAKWCLWYLAVEFENVIKNYKEELENLSAGDREYVENNRWPPDWYLKAMKDYDEQTLQLSRKKSDHTWIPHPEEQNATNQWNATNAQDDKTSTTAKPPLPGPAEKSGTSATKSQLMMGLGMGFGFTFGLIIVTIILWKVCCGLMGSRANPRNQITPRSDEEPTERDNKTADAAVKRKDVDFSFFESN